MVLTDITKAIKKALRKKTPKTGAMLALEIMGTDDGRTISKALGALVASGEAICQGGRPKTYVKA